MSLLRFDAVSLTGGPPLTPPVTGLLGDGYFAAAAQALAGASKNAPAAVLVASLDFVLPAGSPAL